MPKTRITEKDLTGVPLLGDISNTVYIPGGIAPAPEGDIRANEFGPTLVSTVRELDALKPKNDEIFGKTKSYLLAKNLLDNGMKVLYQGFVETGGEITGGEITIADTDWQRLEDRNLYDIRFLSTGGYAIPSAAMLACAANRGDCIALVDHPEEQDYDVDEVRKYFEKQISAAAGRNSDPASFAACFTPWFKKNIGETQPSQEAGGGYVNVDSNIPGSFAYLMAYARSIRTNPSWAAIAGSIRGVVPGLLDVAHRYTTAEVEILQARSAAGEVELDDENDNRGIAINVISYVRPTGLIINSNRTARSNDGYLKATSFLNVRNLVSEINKTMYEAANVCRFEQNDVVLWSKFTSLIFPLLEEAKSNGGLYDYRLTRIATDARGRVKGRLTISAIEAVEDFDLDIVLSDSIDTIED